MENEDIEIVVDESVSPGTDISVPVVEEEKTINELLLEIVDALSPDEEASPQDEELTEIETEEPELSYGTSPEIPYYVDFSELLEFIKQQEYVTKEDVSVILEDKNRTVFDKELKFWVVGFISTYLPTMLLCLYIINVFSALGLILFKLASVF